MTRVDVPAAIERLHDQARAATGLDDFGEEADYLDGLTVLVSAAMDYLDPGEPETFFRTPVGVYATAALVGRLVTERGWKETSGWEQASVAEPIFIVGIPRTATTVLHQLLEADPAHQGAQQWLLQRPQPRPVRAQWEAHPDFIACRLANAAVQEAIPELPLVHDTDAHLVDECWNLTFQTFRSPLFEAIGNVPGYSDWLQGVDLVPAYRRHRDALKLIGVGDERRWVVKDPTHVYGAGAIHTVYPDARIIHLHRDPMAAIPSICSLMTYVDRVFGVETDRRELGRRHLALWAAGLRRFVADREAFAPQQVLDVPFENYVKDPWGTVGSIYDHFGWRWTDEARSRMASVLERERSRPAPPRQALAAFGLTADDIAGAFGDYVGAA